MQCLLKQYVWAVCLGGFLLAFATPGFANDEGLKADCYPGNASVKPGDVSGFDTGLTWARGEAMGSVAAVEEDLHGTPVDLGGAKVELDFVANITGANTGPLNGKSKGRLNAKIQWADHSKGVTVFKTGCAQEIQTQANGFKVGYLEAEYEGGVENFPGYPGTTKAAVASIVVQEDPDNPGRIEVDFSFELGYTCFENVFSGGDIEFEKIALKNLDPDDFHINSTGDHGRWSFPDSFSASVCE